MELTNTHMRYLVAIYCLTRTQEEVSSLDVAGFLGVKKASVSRMTPVLMKKQLLVKEKYGKVYLTGKGYRLAKQMVQQIEQLSDLIRGALPLSEPEVWTAACAAACALAEQRQANPPQAAQPSG